MKLFTWFDTLSRLTWNHNFVLTVAADKMRDDFAMSALTAIIQTSGNRLITQDVEAAYHYADAMMEYRKNPPQYVPTPEEMYLDENQIKGRE